MKKIISILLVCILIAAAFSACGKLGDGKKTLFIYMCGSNLETKQGLAGKNIDEMLSADIGNNTDVIIETGGTQTWRSHNINNDAIERYEVKNGKLKLIETLDNSNMGESATLTDFLIWGQKNYPSRHNSLILWDHGAGAAKGICYDENYSFDPLTLKELKRAFESAKLKNRFDIIGFDACLMASMETAYYVYDYAKYMIASEEIEPSGGWDYKTLCETFSKSEDYIEIGKAVCDSYMQKCKANQKFYATLSLFDLSQIPQLMNQCSAAIEYIEKYARKADYFSEVTEAMKTCEKFGGDNAFQGTANMFDFEDFANKLTSKEYKDLIDVSSFVLYSVNSGQRNNGGVSFFYPAVFNEQEVKDYIKLGVNDNFNRFLLRHYSNIPEKTIEYQDKGSVSDNGAFSVKLTPESADYFSHIDFVLMNTDKNGTRHILCTYNDIRKDWKNLSFESNFRGVSLALNGHRLFCSAVSSNSEYISFIAPVKVNGEKTNLRFVFVWDRTMFNNGYFKVAGLWNGYDENGLPDNDIIPLKSADKVQVVTDTVLVNSEPEENYSEEFTIGEEGAVISELPLDGKEYKYVFAVTDIFGNIFTSDMATFEMTVSLNDLIKKPLPDGTYAAKVTKIEPYKN